jgi:hypothetical protein
VQAGFVPRDRFAEFDPAVDLLIVLPRRLLFTHTP